MNAFLNETLSTLITFTEEYCLLMKFSYADKVLMEFYNKQINVFNWCFLDCNVFSYYYLLPFIFWVTVTIWARVSFTNRNRLKQHLH